MTDLQLRVQTPAAWTEAVLAEFDAFLRDHAAAEKKAAGMAISMLSHYPDKTQLVEAMADLAVEEMSHYRDVVRLIHQRGGCTGPDEKDSYVTELRKTFRKGTDLYFLDRLLIGGIIEARGAERFGLIADALEPGALKRFYIGISRSEQRHENLFMDLARQYFPHDCIEERLNTLLDIEAEIVATLPIRPSLH